MKGELVTMGFLLVFIGMILIFIGMLTGITKEAKGEVKGGGIILIGPFPIIFGSDTESVKTVILLTIFLILLVLFISTRWFR